MPVIGQLKCVANAERDSSLVVSEGKYRVCSPLVALRLPGVGSIDAWNSLPFLVVMMKVDDVTGTGVPFLALLLANAISFSQLRH